MVALWANMIPPSRTARFDHLEVALPPIYSGNEKIHNIPTSIFCHKYILTDRKIICFMVGCNAEQGRRRILYT